MKALFSISLLLISLALKCLHAQEPRVELFLTSEDGQGSVHVFQGMPLTLLVSVISTIGITREEVMFDVPDSLKDDPVLVARLDSVFAPVLFSKTGKPWYESLVLQVESPGQKKKFRPDFHMIEPLPPDVMNMNPDHPLHLFYGIDPQVTAKWKPGLISIRAGLLIDSNQDTLWSGKIKIHVQRADLKKMEDYSKEEKYILGTYWLRRHRCKEAEPFAKNLYVSDSTSFHNTLLMAEVYDCQGEDALALKMFRKALGQFGQIPGMEGEAPVFLMERIMILQQKFLIIKDE